MPYGAGPERSRKVVWTNLDDVSATREPTRAKIPNNVSQSPRKSYVTPHFSVPENLFYSGLVSGILGQAVSPHAFSHD